MGNRRTHRRACLPGATRTRAILMEAQQMKSRSLSILSSLVLLSGFLLLAVSRSTLTWPSSAMGYKAADPDAKRAAFLKMIDRPRVPLAPEAKEVEAFEGMTQIRFSF